MDPLSFSSGEEEVMDVKEEPIDSDHEEDPEVIVSRSVEIYLSDNFENIETNLTSLTTLQNLNESDHLESSTDLVDPFASANGQAQNQEIPAEHKTELSILFGEKVTSDDFEMKSEFEWEDSELSIMDDQLENLSPSKRYVESPWSDSEDTSVNNPNHNSKSYGERKSLRLKNRKHLRYLTVNRNKHFEVSNIWSDDSDKDPDYSPHDDKESSVEGCVKFNKSSNHKKQRNIYKLKKSVINIKKSRHKYNYKRKDYACLYCNRRYIKIGRHLELVHGDKEDVKHFLSLEKGSKERWLAIQAMRTKGNATYDAAADQQATVERLRSRKPRVKRTHVERTPRTGPERIKRHLCLFCNNRCWKLSRHLQECHPDEEDVKKFMSMKKNSKERKAAILMIRNRANFVYNTKILEQKKGNISVVRAQKSLVNEDFLPCNYCLGFFNKRCLANHVQRCCIDKSAEITIQKIVSSDELNSMVELSPEEVIKALMDNKEFKSDAVVTVKKPSKRGVCYYCKKPLTKLAKHLIDLHSEEPEVKHFLSLKKGSKERFMAIERIRKKGNFVHNRSVIDGKKGHILPSRIPNSEEKYKHFLPCEYCFGFFNKNNLLNHTYKCHHNNISDSVKKNEISTVAESKRKKDQEEISSSLLNCYSDSSVTEIQKSIKDPSQLIVFAKKDDLIVKYGIAIARRYKTFYLRRIRKIRELARLLVRMNILDENIVNLRECLKPEHFKTVLKSCLQMCAALRRIKAIDQENSLRMALKHCCVIVKSECVMKGDDSKISEINDFLALIKEYWPESILEKMLKSCESTTDQNVSGEISIKKVDFKIDASLRPKILSEEDVNSLSHAMDSTNDIDHCSSLVYSKKCICMFCNKAVTKPVRHWLDHHFEEPQIKRLAELSKNSPERILLMKALRNKGNYLHNKKVLKSKSGFMVPTRGGLIRNNHFNYLPCEFCLGFYKIALLRVHVKRCPLNPLLAEKARQNYNARYFGSLALYEHKDDSEILQNIISGMKTDYIKTVAINDELIMKYGRMIADQKSTKHEQKLHNYVVSKLRVLAALVVETQQLDCKVKCLKDCFQPKAFKSVLRVAKQMSSSKTNGKSRASFFASLGTSIEICCRIAKSDYVADNNNEKCNEIIDFLILFGKYWVLSKEEKQLLNKKNINKKINQLSQQKDSFKRIPWTIEHLKTISRFFAKEIKCKKLPGKIEIKDCMEQNKFLQQRTWVSIKSKLRDIIKQDSRDTNQCSECKINRKDTNELCNRQRVVSNPTDLQTYHLSNEQTNINPTLESEGMMPQTCNALKNLTYKDSDNIHTPTKNIDFSLADNRTEQGNLTDLPFTERVDTEKDKSEVNMQNNINNISSFNGADKAVGSSLNGDEIENLREERTYLLLGACDLPQEMKTANNEKSSNPDSGPRNIVHKEKLNIVPKDLSKNTRKDEQVKKAMSMDSQDNVSSLTDLSGSKTVDTRGNKFKKKGIRRQWTIDENEALLEYFEDDIKKGKLPSKYECEDCIKENECLQSRDWVSIKSKVHNVIVLSRSNTKRKPKKSKNHKERFYKFTKTKINENDDYNVRKNTRQNVEESGVVVNENKNVKSVTKQRWSQEENEAIEHFFTEQIKNYVVPGKSECERCIAENSCLASRSWVIVKSKVHNIINKNGNKCR